LHNMYIPERINSRYTYVDRRKTLHTQQYKDTILLLLHGS
jgi:hypothetical protein